VYYNNVVQNVVTVIIYRGGAIIINRKFGPKGYSFSTKLAFLKDFYLSQHFKSCGKP